MLQVNPEERLSAADVLEHPWVCVSSLILLWSKSGDKTALIKGIEVFSNKLNNSYIIPSQ